MSADTSSWWSIIPPTVSALVSATGLVIAYKALRTWRLQLVGSNKYTLAKDTLIKLFKLVESIRDFRQPWFPAAEQAAAFEEKEGRNVDFRNTEEIDRAYHLAVEKRRLSVVKVYKEFEEKAIELEILLDILQTEQSILAAVGKFLRQLFSKIDEYDRNEAMLKQLSGTGNPKFQEYVARSEELRQYAYLSTGGEDKIDQELQLLYAKARQDLDRFLR